MHLMALHLICESSLAKRPIYNYCRPKVNSHVEFLLPYEYIHLNYM